MEPPEKKSRKAKTTQQQFQLFLNELRENPHFRENKFNAEEPTALKTAWINLTNKLNASGGPMKDTTAWKKTFSDWKSSVRRRARVLQNSMKETGNVGAPEKPLTELEESLLHLTGKLVVEGLHNVPDIGWEHKENEAVLLAATSTEPSPGTSTTKVTELKKKHGKPKTTINATITKFTDVKESEASQLKKINENLEKIIDQNETIIWLKKKKMELQYSITFSDIEETEDSINQE